LKVKTAAADIDGRRLVGQTRETGKTYSEFKINGTARGNNVLALTYATDLNNATAEATIRGWITITNVEGYQLLDVDNNSLTENYYSQWNRAALTINQLFERHKWLHRESTIEDSYTGSTDKDVIVGNATITEQAQSFAIGANNQYLTRVRVRMKKTLSPTGNLTAKLYAHSGTFGISSVGGGTLHATSVNFDVATLTTAYVEYEIAFTTQFEMLSASTNYVIAFSYAGGNATNYVQIAAIDATAHAGNRSQLAGTWTADATDDLYFKVYASPKQYGISGEVFRGITHEVVTDTPDDTGSTALAVNVSFEVTRAAGSFVTDGFVTGEKVRLSGFTNAGNNSDRVINTVVALTMTFTSTTGMVAEAAGTDERVQGIFDSVEAISWSGGTGQLLAMVFLDTNVTAFSVSAGLAFTRAAGSFITDGFRPGMTIVSTGFTGGNNATKIISSLTATAITVTDTTGLAQEAAGTDERIRAGHIWMQLLTGIAPTDNQTITGATSAATCLMNVTITERTLSQPAVGASTGSAIIGSYGLGIELLDLTASDKVTDLSNTLRIPPNNVTFTVAGLVSGEDRVLVAPLGYEFAYDAEASGPFTLGSTLTFATPTGSGYLSYLRDDTGATGRMQIRLLSGSVPTDNTSITSGATTAAVNGAVVASEDPRQLILSTALTGVTTSVVCTAAIPTDTPPTSTSTNTTIRIQMNTGLFRNIAYTSYSGSTFTIASTDFTSDPADAQKSIFIAYIDIIAAATSATFTGVYLADRNLFVRVRDGASTPIKTFETTGTLGVAGGSATAIRTSDA